MADAYEPPRDTPTSHVDMKPIPTNTRYACAEAMKKAEAEEPWFGIEQVPMPRHVHPTCTSVQESDSVQSTQIPSVYHPDAHLAPGRANVCPQHACGHVERIMHGSAGQDQECPS